MCLTVDCCGSLTSVGKESEPPPPMDTMECTSQGKRDANA